MSRPLPPHGTTARYHRACRCPECRTAHTLYSSEHRRSVRAGHHYTVPADEAYEHLRRLLSAGHTVSGVAAIAGVKRQTLYVLAAGKRERLTRTTAEAVLGVGIDDLPASGSHLVPAEPARRLVAGMRAAGIRRCDLSASQGMAPKSRPVGDGRHVSTRALRRLHVLVRLLAREGIVPAELLEEVSS